jgi:Uma2 family endonuclease
VTLLLKEKRKVATKLDQKDHQPAAFPVERFHRISVDQYHRMIQAGILREDDRVELLEGWMVDKTTHNPPHDGTIQLVEEEVGPRLPPNWKLRIQSAITLATSEPEPDIAVVRGSVRRYLKAHPRPADIGCLMEVAESSVEDDRDRKGIIYARALIPIYWVINIPESQIEAYTEPRGGRKASYAKRQDFKPNDKIPLILDGREIARFLVRNLLP